jgi:C1A family cysteine protease
MNRHGGYGLIPDAPDPRDLLAAPEATHGLPPHVDLRTDKRMPKVWNQGQLGSCTAHGIGAALVFHEVVEVMPSRLFIYYNERALEGTVASDSGAQIRDGIKVVASQGACPESEWPYNTAQFKIKPPPRCYTDGKKELALTYQRVAVDRDQVRAQLAKGTLVVVGISVYSSFESEQVAASGVVPMPNLKTEQNLGGHCIAAVGYDDPSERFIMRNSWGTSWGQDGFFTLPYDYLGSSRYASDFWAINSAGV